MLNSTTPGAYLHKSITSESLNDKCKEPHHPLNNLFVSILSLQKISADDRQFVELQTNSEVKLLLQLKMTISTVGLRFLKNDAGYIQDDTHFVQHPLLCQSSAIRYSYFDEANHGLL